MVPLERPGMIAFLAAEDREFWGLERHLEAVTRLRWPIDYAVSGRLKGKQVVLAANGPGTELVRIAMEQLEAAKVEILVSTGFCGALDPALRACEVFVASEVHSFGMAGRAQERVASTSKVSEFTACRTGPLISVDRVVTTVEQKRRLRESGAVAVEMEARQVAAYAEDHGIPFYCIRVVTDTALESFPLDFNTMRDRSGRFSRSKIAVQALLHPFRLIPELIQLDKRCRNASQALGDFLADCQF